MVARGEGVGRLKKVKGIKRYKLPGIKSWAYSVHVGNVVNNIVTSLCGDG